MTVAIRPADLSIMIRTAILRLVTAHPRGLVSMLPERITRRTENDMGVVADFAASFTTEWKYFAGLIGGTPSSRSESPAITGSLEESEVFFRNRFNQL